MNTLHFTGTIWTKFERKQLSRLIKIYQFSCSRMKIKLTTFPGVVEVHKYDFYDPNCTLREEVTHTIRMLVNDGYEVRVDVKIEL